MVGLGTDELALALAAFHERVAVPAAVDVEEPDPTSVDDQCGIEVRGSGLILKNEGLLPVSAAIEGVGSQDHLMDRCLEWARKPNT